MAKKKKNIYDEVSPFMICPHLKDENVLYIRYSLNNPPLTLSKIKREKTGRITITMLSDFENGFFNTDYKSPEFEDYLFSINLAEGILKAKKGREI